MTTDPRADVPMFDVGSTPVVTPKRPHAKGRPRWSPLHLKNPLKCDDCALVLAQAHGEGPVARYATHRRAINGTDLLLCDAHAQERRDEDERLGLIKPKKDPTRRKTR